MKRLVYALLASVVAFGAQAADLEVPVIDEAPAKAKSDGINIFGFHIGRGGRPDRYVPPVTNPLFNETPFITTELKPIYFYNRIPEGFLPVTTPIDLTGGGDVNVVAAQIRIAITERFGFIATSDGYAVANFNNPLLSDEDGFANIAAGFKYAFYQDLSKNRALTVGARYAFSPQELSTVVAAAVPVELQGAGGAGFIDVFLTGATDLSDIGLPDTAIQASIGANFALNPDTENSFFHASVNLNHELFTNFFPLVEVNAFIPFNDAERTSATTALGASLDDLGLSGLNGVDLVNFGSSDPDPVVTAAGGFRYRFHEHAIFGTAFEAQLGNDDETILDYRVYADLVIHF